MIENTGLLTQNQSFSKMYFKDKDTGYLFGNYQKWPKMSEDELDNPYFTPQPMIFSIICKTTDGGNTWQLIDSIVHREFMDYYTIMDNNIYIGQQDFYGKKYYMSKFNLLNDSLCIQLNNGYLGPITNNNKDVIFSSNYDKLKYCNKNLRLIDSSEVEEIGTELFSIKNKLFSRGFTTINGNQLYEIIKNKKVNLPLSFSLEKISEYDNENLLLVGNNDNEVIVAKYNIITKKEIILKKFKGFRIVKELQYNGKIITGLMGNISGMFVDFVLFYSTDNGETWQISNLKESNYVHPTCLVDNILYIYSGAGRIQKIEF